MFITKSRHKREMREAFGAGWRTNAVGEDAQPASYLDSCEQGDFEEYRRLGLPLYLGALAADEPREPPIDWKAKFKKAITDLEGEIRDRKKAQYDLALARLEVEALRPGHEANERRLRRDREQKAAKRAASR